VGEWRSAWPAVECSKSVAAAAPGGERDGARVDLLRRGPRGGWGFALCALGWRWWPGGMGVAWFGSLEAGACDPAAGLHLHPAQYGLR
jgi:hypothetical protein